MTHTVLGQYLGAKYFHFYIRQADVSPDTLKQSCASFALIKKSNYIFTCLTLLLSPLCSIIWRGPRKTGTNIRILSLIRIDNSGGSSGHFDGDLMPEMCFFSSWVTRKKSKTPEYGNQEGCPIHRLNEIAITDKLFTRHKVSPDTNYEQNPNNIAL